VTGTPRKIAGLSEVAHLYDGYILDLWGVVHDGRRPFANTIPTLKELRRAKRKVWILSNAPRRASTVVRGLAAMGIGPELYGGVHTSGEETHIALRDGYLAQWGRNCFILGAPEDEKVFDGLDVTFVRKPQDADFVFNTVHDLTMEKYIPLLELCAAKKLPMVCVNPDRIVHEGNVPVMCPGALADMYEKMEGKVFWFGKPYHAVYRRVLAALGAENVLAVGDGMQTDIAGASGAGLDSALVVTGIHRGVFSGNENQLQEFFKSHPYGPAYLLEGLIW